MSLPKIQNFLLDVGLYQEFDINSNDYLIIKKLINSKLQVDAFCPSCNKMSTFHTPDEKENIGVQPLIKGKKLSIRI